MARKRRGRYAAGVPLDAYLAFAIFAGVGLATWRLNRLFRLTLLWLALLALTVTYGSGKRMKLSYGFSDIGRGGLAGLLISLPMLLVARVVSSLLLNAFYLRIAL